MRQIELLIVSLIISVTLSGCSYEHYIKDEDIVAQQRKLFEDLCNSDGRFFVKRKVKVDGYLSSNIGGGCTLGWSPILEYNYRYAECIDESIHDQVIPEGVPILHYTLQDDVGLGCKSLDEYFASSISGPRQAGINLGKNYLLEHKKKLQGKCLVVNSIVRPESDYAMYYEYIYIYQGVYYTQDEMEKIFGDSAYIRKLKGMITMGIIKVFNIATREVIAQQLSYAFFPKAMVHVTHATVSCKNPAPSLAIEKILLPK